MFSARTLSLIGRGVLKVSLVFSPLLLWIDRFYKSQSIRVWTPTCGPGNITELRSCARLQTSTIVFPCRFHTCMIYYISILTLERNIQAVHILTRRYEKRLEHDQAVLVVVAIARVSIRPVPFASFCRRSLITRNCDGSMRSVCMHVNFD